MNFSSIKEYFYKLYNFGMMMMLMPLVMFLFIYYLLLSGWVAPIIQDESAMDTLLIAFPTIALATLTIVHLAGAKKFKFISTQVGLSKKLDLYFPIVKMKTRAALSLSLMMAVGLFFTGHEWFSIYFTVIVFWFLLQWPTPRKLCHNLKLKGDEREMVISKGEAFKI